jgi:N-methylhydantoinase B/oxoprolinase/acetone carboxylase alpha subunit
MNESNKSNTVSDNSINQLLEKKGEEQVAELLASSKKTNEEMQTALINIMKEGEKEFIKENKRTMTYLELRSIYG